MWEDGNGGLGLGAGAVTNFGLSAGTGAKGAQVRECFEFVLKLKKWSIFISLQCLSLQNESE